MKRGMDLFGANRMGEILASQKFLVLLLENIEEWARSLGPHVPAYTHLYESLKSQGVTFPVYTQEEMEFNRLRAMQPRDVLAYLSGQLQAQKDSPEKVKITARVLKEKREELAHAVSMATLNERTMQETMTCVDEIDSILGVIETYKQAERQRSVPKKPQKEKPVDRTEELIAKAEGNWAGIEEPRSNGQNPGILDEDDGDEMDIDIRPDLDNLPSVRLNIGFYNRTVKGGIGSDGCHASVTGMIQADIEALLEKSAKFELDQVKITALRDKKRRYKRELEEARERIRDLEARMSHVPSPRASFEHSASAGIMDLLDLDAPVLGLPPIEVETHSLPIQEELTTPINHDFYLFSICKKHEKVYEDSVLLVTFSIETVEERGTLQLVFTNTAAYSMTDVRISYHWDHSQLALEMSSQPSSVLEPGSTYTSELSLHCKSPNLSPPLLLISYQLRSSAISLTLELPVTITRFVHQYTSDVEEVKALWQEIKGCVESVKLQGLRSDIRSLRAVAEVVGCAEAFRTYLPAETELKRTIIAVGRALDSPVITRVSLNVSVTEVEVFCLCPNTDLRASILSLLVEQLQPFIPS